MQEQWQGIYFKELFSKNTPASNLFFTHGICKRGENFGKKKEMELRLTAKGVNTMLTNRSLSTA